MTIKSTQGSEVAKYMAARATLTIVRTAYGNVRCAESENEMLRVIFTSLGSDIHFQKGMGESHTPSV